MKFFLIKTISSINTRNFEFSEDFPLGTHGKSGRFKMNFEMKNSRDEDGNNQKLAGVLKLMVAGCQKNNEDTMTVSVTLAKEGTMGQHVLRLGERGSFLKDVVGLFGKENVGVKITLCLKTMGYFQETGLLSTKDMIVTTSYSENICEDDAFQIPNEKWQNLFRQRNTRLYCCLIVEVNVKTNLNPPTLNHGMRVMFNMLHDEVHSDVLIIAGTGEGDPIKCHKSVLSAASPVFETIFKTDMKESKTHRIEIEDMTEEGVRAFLAYIYYLDLKGPNDAVGLAYELLHAAHKYNLVSDLESEIIKILLAKPVEWFDLEVALKLFALARNLPTSVDDLKVKAVQVVKRNFKALPQSQAYNVMFEKDPAAAKELCQLSFGM